MSETPNVPADWYDDPTDATRLRYWDGAAWTDHYAPKPGAAPAAAPAPVAPGPLLVAGILLVVSGLARIVTNLAPLDVAGLTLGAVVEGLGLIAAFVAFLVAGYPSRRTAPRALAITLIVVYALTMLLVVAGAGTMNLAFYGIAGFLGLVVLVIGVAFGILALRTPGLERRVAVLPLVLYLGLLAFGLLNATLGATGGAATWVVIGISGLVPITVGALFAVFGRRPQTAAAGVEAP